MREIFYTWCWLNMCNQIYIIIMQYIQCITSVAMETTGVCGHGPEWDSLPNLLHPGPAMCIVHYAQDKLVVLIVLSSETGKHLHSTHKPSLWSCAHGLHSQLPLAWVRTLNTIGRFKQGHFQIFWFCSIANKENSNTIGPKSIAYVMNTHDDNHTNENINSSNNKQMK